jgi:transcriptional regulator
MHPNRKFHIDSREEMAAFVREAGFGALVVATEDGLRAVHVPVLIDGGALRFHVSKGNAVHSALSGGCEALFVANGPHAYISPEYYGLDDRVPTWSYVAVELNGPVRRLGEEALVAMLDDLSAEFEARLAPKPPWQRGKMMPGRFEGLLKGIAGFEMTVREWRGTRKLDQDKPDEVRERLAAALAERGEARMAGLVRGDGTGNPGGDVR